MGRLPKDLTRAGKHVKVSRVLTNLLRENSSRASECSDKQNYTFNLHVWIFLLPAVSIFRSISAGKYRSIFLRFIRPEEVDVSFPFNLSRPQFTRESAGRRSAVNMFQFGFTRNGPTLNTIKFAFDPRPKQARFDSSHRCK
ncbi:hypothetical protein Zmor_002088 [Zophobas morio]|uniref:Uncharacterized protein n=1 Tax=Zophobas morio TaxID=2755281 RepID=A0AA38MTH7_9CUCU|nr:hypothetical protein Zmor_002088 [Zophobas morio]